MYVRAALSSVPLLSFASHEVVEISESKFSLSGCCTSLQFSNEKSLNTKNKMTNYGSAGPSYNVFRFSSSIMN